MLLRENSHLDTLPLRFKWETTRRLPLYIWIWDTLQVLNRSESPTTEQDFSNHPAYQFVSAAISVNGLPVDPATEFKDLAADIENVRWLNRATRPVTNRFLANLLLAKLSPNTLRLLSGFLFEASDTEVGSDERDEKLLKLGSAEWEDLDALVDVPIVLLNPAAPAAEFVSDLTNLRDEWRVKRGLRDSRTRESKYENYLRAWDLREAWAGGKYHRDAVLSLKDVASELGQSKTTAKNWYRGGFQLVSGHEFTPEKWVELMGAVQLSELVEGSVSPISTRRAIRTPSRRELDDTTLSGGRNNEGTGVVEQLSTHPDQDGELRQITQDILSLIAKKRSNEEIREELGLSGKADKAIEVLRETGAI